MRALVINCLPADRVGRRHYNLGARKLADWLGGEGYAVEYVDGDPGIWAYGHDLVCLSAVFSWHVPVARDIAVRVGPSSEVWAGGPGFAEPRVRAWFEAETGVSPHRGLDARFERQRGDYRMTFASRGCPVNCWFCVVPRIEGKTFTLDWEFAPAPVLCDNNLSALPVEFQEHIISRYRETGAALVDANSGFEPRAFDGGTYERWRAILRGPWRFAFDEMGEAEDVRRMMGILGEVSPRRKQVYVLVGNEPIAACYERARKVIELGGEPYCQPVIKLDALTKQPWVRHDWTAGLLRDFARYFNRRLWRWVPLAVYSDRAGEPPPFAGIV
jgi:hypothetical protein